VDLSHLGAVHVTSVGILSFRAGQVDEVDLAQPQLVAAIADFQIN